MNVGDKVRLLHGKEEGIVTKKLDRGLVEVEIEDGFGIPVLETELVVVAADESTAFSDKPRNTVETKKTAKPKSVEKGYYVAIIPLNDQLHSIYLINQENSDALVLVNELNNKHEEKSILSEKIFAGNRTKITERNLNHLNTWPTLSITILEENNSWSIAKRPEKINLSIKAKHFKGELKPITSLNKNGYLIPLNSVSKENIEPEVIDADKLREGMYAQKEQSFQREGKRISIDSEVDLHIEALRSDADQIKQNEILDIQLRAFEQKLSQAIAAGLDEITFIHGVGNGILRNKIHKYLSQSDHIKFFKDAQKEKFGYGATLVRIN
ncbi:hypothetical protein GCM10027429_23610 [Marivirga atlantica]|jgi:DNA-nicking Smr family endonuclease|uniref:Smr/MutS family protein n=1 Tax=Marivirga atlantica TaxID=1548457 RepID=A0A937ABU0_9BACT|nr:Smr/MutS family protein [Marivirga atlantica]MBL0765960.1 Smr/MutS family protein [Marivirga atlantica]